MRLSLVLLSSALLFMRASAVLNTFYLTATARFEMGYGHYEGKVYYKYDGTGAGKNYLKFVYSTPISMTELIDYGEGVRYKVCSSTCEAEYYTRPMPVLAKQSSDVYANVNENGCKKYIPSDTSGINAIWYDDKGTICKVELPDKTFTLSNIATTAIADSVFASSSSCPKPVCKRMMDLVFVVDISGSVGNKNWVNTIKPFLKNLVNSFDIGADATQVSLVTYGTTARTVFELLSDKTTIINRITSASYTGGSTCTGCGIDLAMDILKAAKSRSALDPEKIIIVMTDGKNCKYTGNPCADYSYTCTSNTGCKRYKCSTGYKNVTSNVCEVYGYSSTCKRYKCTACNGAWGACIKQTCTSRSSSNCAKYNTNYCIAAYPSGCKLKNGALTTTYASGARCLCARYQCVEYECSSYRCDEYACSNCKTRSNVCSEYEKKCNKYAQIQTCAGTETCAERECSAGTISCKSHKKSNAAMLMGAIVRTRTPWALYPASKRLPIVIAIGVGKYSLNELSSIASTLEGKQFVYTVSNFNALSSLFDDLIDETCVKQVKEPTTCDSGCKGFCGCNKQCYCPTCDTSTGSCYSISCTRTNNGKATNGCVATHNKCPNTNKCITLTPDNNTAGCCVQKTVDCSHMSNKCYTAKCNVNTGCYFEKIQPNPPSPCFVGDVCNNATGWTYKSACSFIDNCTNNVCTVTPNNGFTCAAEAKCDSKDKCIIDSCDMKTGTCSSEPVVCPASNKCNIPYCYNGNCYERANDTKKAECALLTDADSCKRGYCDSESGKCRIDDYTSSPACNACKNFNVSEKCKGTACEAFDCGVDEHNNAICNKTKECKPSNPCEEATCDEKNGECKITPVKCPSVPCHTSTCIVDETAPNGYVCNNTPIKVNTSCVKYICDEKANTYITKSACPEPEKCFVAQECYADTEGNPICNTTPKVCTSNSKCKEAYCDKTTGECALMDISAELCPPKPCKSVICDDIKGCIYTAITCDDGDSCTDDECVPINDTSDSEFDTASSEGISYTSEDLENGYVCTHTPRCAAPGFCWNATCNDGDCTINPYNCEYMEHNFPLDSCHGYECDEEKKACKVILLPAAFLDVCGSCVKEYGDDPDLDIEIESTKCVGNMKLPDFAAAISGAAVAGIVIAAIVVAAVIGVSSTIATKELIKRAKKNADTGTNSNPLYEGNDNESSNPAYTGDNN